MDAAEQSGLGDPCMCAAPAIKDAAVSKPDTGHAWEFKGQKGAGSILRLADVREYVEQTRQLCELGNCHRNHS